MVETIVVITVMKANAVRRLKSSSIFKLRWLYLVSFYSPFFRRQRV